MLQGYSQDGVPVKIKKEEKKALRKISKRKRSNSEDEPVHKKIKDCRCPICLEDMDTKKNVTLDCDCVYKKVVRM